MKVSESMKFRKHVCLPKDFRENIRVKGIMMVMEEGQCSVPADHDRMAFPSAVSPPPQSCPSLLSPLPVAPRASGARPAHTARRNCLHLLEAHHVHRPPEGGPGLPFTSNLFLRFRGIFHAKIFYCVLRFGRQCCWAYPHTPPARATPPHRPWRQLPLRLPLRGAAPDTHALGVTGTRNGAGPPSFAV